MGEASNSRYNVSFTSRKTKILTRCSEILRLNSAIKQAVATSCEPLGDFTGTQYVICFTPVAVAENILYVELLP